MTERFLVLCSALGVPSFLARLDQPDDADALTGDRMDARRFEDRADADAVRADLVARTGVAFAVVPERVGPGPDRPAMHGEAP